MNRLQHHVTLRVEDVEESVETEVWWDRVPHLGETVELEGMLCFVVDVISHGDHEGEGELLPRVTVVLDAPGET